MIPPKLITHLQKLDIRIFSIADHNACGNAAAFQEAATDAGLLFVPAIELMSLEEVHILAYFPSVEKIERFYDSVVLPSLPAMKNDPKKFGNQFLVDKDGEFRSEDEHLLALPLLCDIDRLCRSIHEGGGICVPSHLDKSFSLIEQLGFIPETLEIDAVEIYFFERMAEIKKNYLKGTNYQILSSSDTHHIAHLPRPKMRLWMKEFTTEEVLLTIKGTDGRRIALIHQTPPSYKKNDWRRLYK